MSKLSKQSKLMLGSVLFVVILLAVPYFVGKYLADEHRLIDRLERSVQTGNSDKLYELLAEANKDIKFQQQHAEQMVSYLQAHPDELKEVVKQLKQQSRLLRSSDTKALTEEQSSGFIHLNNKNWKRWIFFEDYELKLKQYDISVETNVEGAQILLDGQMISEASSEGTSINVGPLLPGEYSFEAVWEGEYTTLRKVEKVALYPLEAYEGKVELLLEGDYVTVQSNNPQASILINGEEIGLKARDGQRIGPISLDGSDIMVLEADYPWGAVRSEELKIDQEELVFTFEGLNEELKESIIDATEQFVETRMKALASKDSRQLKHANSERVEDVRNHIDIMTTNGQTYIGTLHNMTIDRDSITLVSLNEGHSVLLEAQVDLEEVTYRPYDNIEPVPLRESMRNEFELIYEDGQWRVANWYESGGFGMDIQ